MASNCKACGRWFASSDPRDEICFPCKRALERMNGYAVPVVHGRWIEHSHLEIGGECSVCGWQFQWFENDEAHYCPHCGAKMDLEVLTVVIPKHIREKMHKIADLHYKAAELSKVVDNWFIEHGFDIEELRDGSGISLEELDYGNDVTDAFCERIESGDFCSYGKRRTDGNS